MKYFIRAELPESVCRDFTVSAPDGDLEYARRAAEHQIRSKFSHIKRPLFKWVGQVVFVNPKPKQNGSTIMSTNLLIQKL